MKTEIEFAEFEKLESKARALVVHKQFETDGRTYTTCTLITADGKQVSATQPWARISAVNERQQQYQETATEAVAMVKLAHKYLLEAGYCDGVLMVMSEA